MLRKEFDNATTRKVKNERERASNNGCSKKKKSQGLPKKGFRSKENVNSVRENQKKEEKRKEKKKKKKPCMQWKRLYYLKPFKKGHRQKAVKDT